ncbi:hypothetical protein [Pantoea sp. C2G6]|uniref:hypothetical protein n=1 Tax=Pantoea sp. C2G6 TaxID=3243084 RepID=UPI003ED9D007
MIFIFSFSVYHCQAADLVCNPQNQVVNLGVIQEGVTNNFNAYKDGPLNYFTCNVNRTFLYGASLSYTVEAVAGNARQGVLIPMAYNNTQLSGYKANTATNLCLGPDNFACNFRLNAGSMISFSLSYRVLTNINGTGIFLGKINLYQTPRVLTGQSEQITSFYYTYTIAAKPCMVSNTNLLVNFKDLDNRLATNPNREVALTVNCPAQTNVDVLLSPSQQVVTASQGLSKTSLAGLNMQVYQNGLPIVLNQTSTRQFQQGINSYRLAFYPRLATSVTPVGSFSADYTLTFDYK